MDCEKREDYVMGLDLWGNFIKIKEISQNLKLRKIMEF
jgi:hypothetical protein